MMPAGGSGPSQKNEIDWGKVERVLVVKLRSIGDTVLSTPSLIALKRFLPNAEIDILLEINRCLSCNLEISVEAALGFGGARLGTAAHPIELTTEKHLAFVFDDFFGGLRGSFGG